MDFELWWLLPIPALFFALGWIAARIDIKHLLHESRALPLSYFKGLNFLLNEQPDKAIESFIEVVKVDPQTIDLHFALGSRCSAARARPTARSACTRTCSTGPTLPADKRTMATYELAQDFHRAGLLDRAEDLFRKLDGSPFEHSALSHLISIYETEKDWPKAISATRRMEVLAKQPYHKEIAQYHCELAQAALVKPDRATVQAELERALAMHRGCTRANLVARRPGVPGKKLPRRARGLAADRIPGSRLPRARRRPHCRRVSQAGRRARGNPPAAQLPAAVPVARHPERAVRAGAGARGAGVGGHADQGRARAQSDADRPRSAARGAAHGGAGRSAPRPAAGQGTRRRSTSSAWVTTAATNAASAPSNTTGAAPAARNGRPILRGAPRCPTAMPDRRNASGSLESMPELHE